MKEKGRQWDGRSRIATEEYKNNYNEIFKKKENENETTEDKKQDTTDKLTWSDLYKIFNLTTGDWQNAIDLGLDPAFVRRLGNTIGETGMNMLQETYKPPSSKNIYLTGSVRRPTRGGIY